MSSPPPSAAAYDPIKFWTEEITDMPPNKPGQRVEDIPAHKPHCEAIRYMLDPVSEYIDTVFEIGCGYGRITKFMLESYPNIRKYDAVDVSNIKVNAAREYIPVFSPHYQNKVKIWNDNFAAPRVINDRLEEQRRNNGGYSLVLTTQCLMHQLPADIDYWVKKIGTLSKKYIFTLDWFEEREPDNVAAWNFIHNYDHIFRRQLDPKDIRTLDIVGFRQRAYLITKQ
jgi:SAM-dependent methyltransferase